MHRNKEINKKSGEKKHFSGFPDEGGERAKANYPAAADFYFMLFNGGAT